MSRPAPATGSDQDAPDPPAVDDGGPGRRHRPRTVTVAVGLVLVLVALLGAEGATRYLEPAMYGRDAGNAPEAVRKADQMAALSANPPEVVAVGDSSLDAGFDPQAFLAASSTFSSAYNASLVGSRVPTQQLWNEQLVIPDLHPRLAIQGLSPALTLRLDNAIDPNVVDNVLNQSVRSLDDSLGQRVERAASSWSALVRNRSSLRSPREVWEALGRRVRGEAAPASATNPPGYWDRNLAADGQNEAYADGVVGPTAPAGLIPLLQKLVAGDQDLQPVDALVRSYKKAGVPLVVVIPPVALDVLSDSGVDAGKWRAATTTLVDHLRAGGVPVIDMTDAGFDRTLFFDPLHLNDAGAHRFSTELAHRVDALCRSDASLGCGA